MCGTTSACLGDVFLEARQNVFGLWVAAEHRFREDQFAVEVNVEDAVLPGNDLDRIDDVLPLLENPRDQTGRVGQRASGNAVLDTDTMPRRHRSIVVPLGLASAAKSFPEWMFCQRRESRLLAHSPHAHHTIHEPLQFIVCTATACCISRRSSD